MNGKYMPLLNSKDSDIKYVFVRKLLKYRMKTGCQPRSFCLRRHLCMKTVLNILYEI